MFLDILIFILLVANAFIWVKYFETLTYVWISLIVVTGLVILYFGKYALIILYIISFIVGKIKLRRKRIIEGS